MTIDVKIETSKRMADTIDIEYQQMRSKLNHHSIPKKMKKASGIIRDS